MKLNSKGQVTIPAELRQSHGFVEGDEVEVVADAFDRGPVVINPIVYAEVSIGFDRIEDLNNALPSSHLIREALPWEAGFVAGKAFLSYRRRVGARSSPLPDFYIGAHAAVAGHAVLTRDRGRYSSYFPSLTLIIP